MIYRYLIENGHSITYDPTQADYIIINTCGFSRNNEEKSCNLFQKYYALKKKSATIIMFGCLVRIDENRLMSLDVVPIGHNDTTTLDQIFCRTNQFNTIQPYCDESTKRMLLIGKQPYKFAESIPFLFSKLFIPFIKRMRINYDRMVRHVKYIDRTFIVIGTGCIGDCSYCVIKKAKGNLRSRSIEEIEANIRNIHFRTKNIFLVAEDCGCYGVDIKTNLFELLYNIHNTFPEASLDLNNVNPQWLEKQSEEYIKLFEDITIDFALIPLQSGSHKIIKQMNRHYDPEIVVKIIDRIKKESPKTLMYTHFIVGFPGESTLDFLKTVAAVRHFDYPIPFKYSSNKGAASSRLPQQKSNVVISLRYALLMAVINIVIFSKLITIPPDDEKC